MTHSDKSLLPPETRNADGTMRRLGVELEFSGMDMKTASTIVQGELGGSVEAISDYEHRVRDTDLGDFNVELDFAYLKTVGREKGATDDEGSLENLPEWFVAEVARHVVPIEVVSPPIEMDRIERLDAIVGKLREAGARGTRYSPVYAFGLHLNPEMPALDAETICAYLRAFLCLYEWLLQVSEVDWSRRVTPYINPFPTEYVRQVLKADYAPSLSELIDDYLDSNADRNRALDMLPLFAHLDEERVRQIIDDPRIKPRPTLHYRLPNCDVDRQSWGIHIAWRHWLQVEHLACDRNKLVSIAEAYHEHLERITDRAFGDWAERCRQWLSGSDG